MLKIQTISREVLLFFKKQWPLNDYMLSNFNAMFLSLRDKNGYIYNKVDDIVWANMKILDFVFIANKKI